MTSVINEIYYAMLKKGIYENIVNQQVEDEMLETENHDLYCKCEDVDKAESPQILANYLADVIRKKLEETEKQQDRVRIVNNILANAGFDDDFNIVKTDSLLTEVMTQEQSLLQEKAKTHTVRPMTGFRVSNLFTGGSSPIQLGEEIRREIASADEICLIVSFLRFSGTRIIIDDLRKFCEQEGKRLRIITTTYCGVTEAKAIEQMAELPNTEIRISYNSDNERLHAKSYIFVRNSGMSTAYIGSSNLSKSAQTDGLEWNVRVTSVENPHIIKTALATFERYWNSPNFEDFNEGGIKKFNEEIHRSTFRENGKGYSFQRYSLLPHQKMILDKLRVEREENHNYRNLVVAATGTGKTVISAFDYLDFKHTHSRSRILFTAHREEILRQSLSTYRNVLNDANFGALWVGGTTPRDDEDFEYLFVSISMLNSRFDEFFGRLDPTFFDYIVIDEAHHSQADSYRKLLGHFKPKILLGLTATPERMDGRDLRPDFGNCISAEIRLPQALQAGLLTPFQYMCVTDTVDLSSDTLWNGQRYVIEKLSSMLCDKTRAKHIVNTLHKYLANEYSCRALCFCVNKNHADFMAEQLSLYGFNAKSLTSDTPSDERKAVANQLREGTINYLCVVDIFNEGVDIPEVDTVLFLRPTESLTIFLQQLGRGLRLSAGKTELTVLDFVAQANKKYDFGSRFRALMLRPERSIRDQVKEGFTLLPYGCSIIMEKKARQYILDNIQSAIYNKNRLVRELQSYVAVPTISQFIENNGQDIRIIYKGMQSRVYSEKQKLNSRSTANDLVHRCWSSLKREAGLLNYFDDDITVRLAKGMGYLIHHNTARFLHFVNDFIEGSLDYQKPEKHTYALMLYYVLFQDKLENVGVRSLNEALELVHKKKYECFKDEMREIVAYLLSNLQIQTKPLEEEDGIFPQMELYGCYTREEIFTLVGKQDENTAMKGSVPGVFNLKEHNATLLFVTLNKSDKDFSPSTLYDDYVINENFFHWQSQNTDAHTNSGGKRYVDQAKTRNKILLFVREEKRDGFGNTCPFHCFGFVDYVSSHGNRPMNVTWKLKEAVMPQYLKAI